MRTSPVAPSRRPTAAESIALTFTHDELWPREPRYRYRLYLRGPDGLEILNAAPDLGGIGLALATRLDEDGPLEGLVGVLDTHPYGSHAGSWMVNPHAGGTRV